MYEEYVVIPGFSRYKINRHGQVYDTLKNSFVIFHQRFNEKYDYDRGYYYMCCIYDDDGVKRYQSRHRLLMLSFVKPDTNLDRPIVNHINGIKGDDRLCNLEWTDYKGNLEHAGKVGLTKKCLPVASRCVYSGEVKFYPSVVEMSKESGFSKDAGAWRLKFGKDRIFPEMKQYRIALDKTDWPMPTVEEIEMVSYGSSVKTLLKDVTTGVVKEFNTAREVALEIGVCEAVVSNMTSQNKQILIKDKYLIKRKDDQTNWKKIDDIEHERLITGITKGVTVEYDDGRIEKYDSLKNCAKALGIGITTVHYRVKNMPGIRTRCGKKFSYTLDYNSI